VSGDAILDGAALDLALHGAVSDARAYLARFGYDAPPLDQTADDVAQLDVEVNHGIWIWHCPFCASGATDPPGGGVVWRAWLYGWCPRCQNVETDGRWRPLRLPDDYERIEAALALRTDEATRNAWPGETAADLERENAAHGVAP
jgi:hypothetical protein